MSDRFFYPFFILLCAAIVVGALFAGGGLRADAPDVDPISDGFVLEGESLRRLVQPLGATLDFATDSEGNTAYAVLAAHMTREDAPPSAGIFAELSSVYEAAYGGRTLTVTVRARQGQETVRVRPVEQRQLNERPDLNPGVDQGSNAEHSKKKKFEIKCLDINSIIDLRTAPIRI